MQSSVPKSSVSKQSKEKTKLEKKTNSELSNLFFAQELQCGQDAVWVIKFRSDGNYMATGGKDGVLRIWNVLCQGTEESNSSPTNSINRPPSNGGPNPKEGVQECA